MVVFDQGRVSVPQPEQAGCCLMVEVNGVGPIAGPLEERGPEPAEARRPSQGLARTVTAE
jgi:hypothetical protein